MPTAYAPRRRRRRGRTSDNQMERSFIILSLMFMALALLSSPLLDKVKV
jgi:hypothetical protein